MRAHLDEFFFFFKNFHGGDCWIDKRFKLYDGALRYAERLREAGVPVTILSYPTIHNFIVMANALDIGKQAIKDASMQLKKLFG